jgi:hypothetical protein
MIATPSAPSATNTYPVRKEVLDFVFIAETLLGRSEGSREFTEEECGLIAEYVMNMSRSGNPWSKSRPVRYNT